MDVRPLKAALEKPGPYASVYVDVSRNTEDADKQVELRSRAVGEDLVTQGAPQTLADRVVERLQEHTGAAGSVARLVVAAEAEILLDDVVPRQGGPETVTWGPWPDVTAWIADRESMPGPVLQVLADREGADLTLFQDWPGPAIAEEQLHGDTLHINKVAGGDWAQVNYQRRSENVWRRNANDVAAEIAAMADRGATWVALAGDLRAVADVRDAVDESVRSLLVDLETGGRAAGGSDEALHEAMDRAALEIVGRRRAAVAAELAEQLRHDGAVTGIAPVLDALTQGQVRIVIIDPPVLTEHEVRLRDHPGIPTPPGSDDRAMPQRADLVIGWQAARTDADVVVPSDPELTPPDPAPGPFLDDGVAAILRWSTKV